MIDKNLHQRNLTALVTGGAGFIGSHLVQELLAVGYRVVVLDDLSTGREENLASVGDGCAFQLVRGSVSDATLVESLVKDSDIVVHLAAAVGVKRIFLDPVSVVETNVLGTHWVLKAAARYGKKVLLASSSEIYGKSGQVPFGEDDDCVLGPTTKARWTYAASKAIDEYLALAYHREEGLPVVIFRLFNTVGPRQTGRYGMVLPRFVTQALKGNPLTIYGDGSQTRCFLDVQDAVRAILGLAESPMASGQVFNVGSTQEVTILELANRVLIEVGGALTPDNGVVFIPYNEPYGDGFEDMLRRVPDVRKIRDFLGWEPGLALSEIIGRVVEGLRLDDSYLREE